MKRIAAMLTLFNFCFAFQTLQIHSDQSHLLEQTDADFVCIQGIDPDASAEWKLFLQERYPHFFACNDVLITSKLGGMISSTDDISVKCTIYEEDRLIAQIHFVVAPGLSWDVMMERMQADSSDVPSFLCGNLHLLEGDSCPVDSLRFTNGMLQLKPRPLMRTGYAHAACAESARTPGLVLCEGNLDVGVRVPRDGGVELRRHWDHSLSPTPPREPSRDASRDAPRSPPTSHHSVYVDVQAGVDRRGDPYVEGQFGWRGNY